MTKTTILLAIAVVFVAGTIVSGTTVFAANGKPFQTLVDAIDALDVRIAALEGGSTTISTYNATEKYLPVPGFSTYDVRCDSGDLATGGGWKDGAFAFTGNLVRESGPTLAVDGTPDGWLVEYHQTQSFDIPLTVHVICIDNPPLRP